VPAGGEALVGVFEVELLPGCPSPGAVPVSVELLAENGLTVTLDYTITVGPWFDDCETHRGWTLGAIDDNATSGHWVRADPVGTTNAGGEPVQPEDDHTPAPGVMCFVTGNAAPGSSAGANDVDGGWTTLQSPIFDLSDATAATLTYWRYYTNDRGNNPGEDPWSVIVSDDGEDWSYLEYTHSSTNAWVELSFDLSHHVAFTDFFQVRFIASDTGAGALVEAAVDDFTLDVTRRSPIGVEPGAVEAVRTASGFVAIRPNPFNPTTTIDFRVGAATRVSLRLYDVGGRMVRTLVDGMTTAGEHTIVFDGTSSAGASLASGIYFLRLETPEIMQVRQIALVK
jgi:hypothetical protein